jgi:phosphopantothenate-cysteine ligase
VKEDKSAKLASVLKRYREVQGRLLLVPFTSLGDYLHLLRAACSVLRPLSGNAMLYLAAAVSDFYIPADRMVSVLCKIMIEKSLC